MVDKRDLNLQLCSDDPIFVGGVPIYPIPISEIAKIGYMRFNAEVRLLCLNESDISAMTGNDISDIGVFKYLVANAMRDQGLMNTILFWRLWKFFKEKRATLNIVQALFLEKWLEEACSDKKREKAFTIIQNKNSLLK